MHKKEFAESHKTYSVLFILALVAIISGCAHEPSPIGYNCAELKNASIKILTITIDNRSYAFNSEVVVNRFFVDGDDNQSTNFLGYSMNKIHISNEARLNFTREIFTKNSMIYLCQGLYGT